jgi:hypothetical protein
VQILAGASPSTILSTKETRTGEATHLARSHLEQTGPEHVIADNGAPANSKPFIEAVARPSFFVFQHLDIFRKKLGGGLYQTPK